MGYDLHITRKENWFDPGPGITLSEWLSYVDGDTQLRHDGFAEAAVDNGQLVRVEGEGLCVWTGYSGGASGDGVCWISWSEGGDIAVKNPDDEVRRKMWAVANRLGARVQGDEGEFYGPDGGMIADATAIKTVGEPTTTRRPASKRPWWRFW